MSVQVATPSGEAWRGWIGRLLLFVGAGQILAGVFFFFAYNWDDLTRWQKLGATEAAFVLAALGARFVGLETLVGKVFLLVAGALVGAALAVFGQTYQTGADAFDLFAAWALLIFGWVLIARLAGFWILWLAIVNIALSLYLSTFTLLGSVEQLVLFGVLNGGFLLLHERARRDVDWFDSPWSRWLLMVACLGFFSLAALSYIQGLDHIRELVVEGWAGRNAVGAEAGPLAYLALPGFLACVVVFYRRARRSGPDIFGLFLVILCVSIVTWFGVVHVIDEVLDPANDVELVIHTLLSLTVFGFAAWWLFRFWNAGPADVQALEPGLHD